jgi:hypothetical protein
MNMNGMTGYSKCVVFTSVLVNEHAWEGIRK